MDTIELTRQFGRYGYRMITGMLNNAGWHVNHKRVERIWRRTRRQVPQKRAKRCRLWLNDLSCLRLRPKHPNQVWSYDFVQDRTHDGKTIRTRDGIDEFTKKALVIRAKRRLNSADVVDAFADLSILRGPTKIIGSDSGAEVIAEKLRILMGPAPLKSCWNGSAATGQPQRGDCRSRTNEGRSIAELPE